VEWAIATGFLATGRFNLDDVGAKAGENLAAMLAEFVCELDHAQAVEKTSAGSDCILGQRRASLVLTFEAHDRPVCADQPADGYGRRKSPMAVAGGQVRRPANNSGRSERIHRTRGNQFYFVVDMKTVSVLYGNAARLQ
jgi:hypothetical protein